MLCKMSAWFPPVTPKVAHRVLKWSSKAVISLASRELPHEGICIDPNVSLILMFSRLIYILITATALQFSWGVITAYCIHNADSIQQVAAESRHIAVAWQEANTPVEQLDSSKKVSSYSHCSFCNHGALSFATISGATFPPLPSGITPVSNTSVPSSVISPPPDRPQWSPLA